MLMDVTASTLRLPMGSTWYAYRDGRVQCVRSSNTSAAIGLHTTYTCIILKVYILSEENNRVSQLEYGELSYVYSHECTYKSQWGNLAGMSSL